MILAIDAIPAVSICLGGLWITILILFLWINEVSFEEIELFFVLNIGCIIETELVEVAEYLLDEDGTGGVRHRLPEFVADFKCFYIE